MKSISKYIGYFKEYLDKQQITSDPKGLYEPIDYIIRLGGKRIRPAITLMSTDVFGGKVKDALEAALAIEVFHNFSLVHDDVMDKAPLRRSKSTVHHKWDLNTAILSGDAMLIWAYTCFEKYDKELFYKLVPMFSKTAKEVCVGQQLDMDFEKNTEVKLEQYVEMIRLKTAVLVALSFQIGAIIADSSPKNQEEIYNFGQNLGIAFQIQDDLLDIYGNPESFGKQIGGDIIANKKTFLYLKALELSSTEDKKTLIDLYSYNNSKNQLKVDKVVSIFNTYDIKNETTKQIQYYKEKAIQSLQSLYISKEKKEKFLHFTQELMERKV